MSLVAHLQPEQLEEFRQLVIETEAGRDAHGPVREVQMILSDRWASLLLLLLRFGPMRFSTLEKAVAVCDNDRISRRMLALKLRLMRRDGLIRRTVYASAVPHVEYEHTPFGAIVYSHLHPLLRWLRDNKAEVEAARQAFDAEERATGPADNADSAGDEL